MKTTKFFTIFAGFLLIAVSVCAAQNKDSVRITTYYPSPNLAVENLVVKDTATITNQMVIKQDSNNSTNNYFSVGSGGNSVLYLGENAANFDARFIGNIFVEDTAVYGNCSIDGSGKYNCDGSVEGRLARKEYASKPYSLELSGVVLRDIPHLSDPYFTFSGLLPIPPPSNDIPDYANRQNECYYNYNQQRAIDPNSARINFNACIHGLRNNLAYPALVHNTTALGTPNIRQGKIGYIKSLKRNPGFFIAIGVGSQEAFAFTFGREFFPTTYNFTSRKWIYDVDPCYYDALSAQCGG